MGKKNIENKSIERRPNFDFIEMGIPFGSELVAISDPNVKVTVKDNRKVLYNGKEYYLSALEDELQLQGNPCEHWTFNGTGLNDIYNETYKIKEIFSPREILNAVRNEIEQKYNKQFYIPKPNEDYDTWLWIGDAQHLIGDHKYHYEVNIGDNKDYEHDGKHVFIELHIGESDPKNIANNFGNIISSLQNKSEINAFSWCGKIPSLRLEKGKNGHQFNEKNLINTLLNELVELDCIVGPVMREKISEFERPERLKKLIEEYKKFFQKDKKVAFYDEAYKWELLNQYKGKKDLELVNAVRSSNNLIYPSDGATLKTLSEKVPTELLKIINNLLDENKDIIKRLADFKSDMKSLVKSNLNSTNYAEDERTASDYLTYTYYEKYTFYTFEIYNSFCKYLGITTKKTGEIYPHYCELLHQLESFISKDNELLEQIANESSNYYQSNLLLAQNIVYVMLKEGNFYRQNGGESMSTKSKELIEYTDLLENKLNVILQGAPGTGKTYMTASLALSICNEELDYNDRVAVMERYKKLRDEGRIGFCTFHQSMDYEDFVEGLKPQNDGSDKVIYDVEDGLFKRICKKALDDGNQVSDNFDQSIERFIAKLEKEEKLTISTQTGKSFTVYLNQNGDGLVDEQPSYSRFYNFKQLYNVYRGLPGVPNKGHDNYRKAIIDYMQDKNNGIGLNPYNPAAQSSGKKPYVLIIDEINRGYVSKIFGELITLLETDKRLGNSKTELTVELPYSKEEHFGVPKNLYIIGTMNTTDRSTGTLDYAVRRRFAFVTLEANENILEETNACEQAKALFKDVKAFIENNKLEDIDIGDLMIGHSYFMTDKPKVLKQKIKYEVIPLVKEYIKDGILTCLTSEAKPYFDDWLELRVHDSQVSEIEQ